MTQTATPIPVTKDQLPFSCPPKGSDSAEMHPRVFIPLKKVGDEAICPYCGAHYRLQD